MCGVEFKSSEKSGTSPSENGWRKTVRKFKKRRVAADKSKENKAPGLGTDTGSNNFSSRD